jgi:hypothetical protein
MKLLLPRLVAAIAVAASCVAAANAQTTQLSRARAAFQTQISYAGDGRAAPAPPASVFRKITYPSAVGPLAAYLSPDPQDRSRHPAIIWITGGDCNSIDDVWSFGQ